MVGTVVTLVVVAALVAACRIRRNIRRRAARAMYVPTRPGIELSECYGGWDANAYDTGPRRPWTAPPPTAGARILPTWARKIAR